MSSALLIMDVQEERTDKLGTPAFLEALGCAARGARELGVPVIHVKVVFREGHPEIARHGNPMFASLARSGGLVDGAPGTDFHRSVTPRPGEPIVTKRRVSGFAGSDLDVILRGLDIDTLVLTGIATSGVVLSTYTEAADRDYRLVVLEDACVDMDDDLHEALVQRYFPRMAEVMTADAWVASLD